MESFSSRQSTSSTPDYASAPGIDTYSVDDVRKLLRKDLEGRMRLNSSNVLERLGITKVDDNLVKNCVNRLNTNPEYMKNKETLLRLVALADGKSKNKGEGEPPIESNKGTTTAQKRKRAELPMMDPLVCHSALNLH